MKKTKPPPDWQRLPRTVKSATIIGLGGVGRQVAIQLAGLGIRRLQLVDARVVSITTHAGEGYSLEDVGRKRVHATAQLCHQLNPMLNVHALSERSIKGVDPGDAVLCCQGPPSLWRALGRWTPQCPLVACCDVVGTEIHLAFHRGAGPPVKHRDRGRPPGIARRTAVPIHIATVAAGLLVAELVRFASGKRNRREVRLDLNILRSCIVKSG